MTGFFMLKKKAFQLRKAFSVNLVSTCFNVSYAFANTTSSLNGRFHASATPL